MPTFGTIGFQPGREGKKTAYFKLSDAFMDMNGLEMSPNQAEYEQQAGVVLAPTIKPVFASMAKSVNLEKNIFYASLINMLTIMGEIMSEHQSVEVDLLDFGKFQAMNGQVMYQPASKVKASGLQGKQTVKNLMDLGGSQRHGMLP